MLEKIKWYQEVLELEPGSKVFFPLARLLVQSGQIDAALQALQQGLVRYPEFIEARLYLIDVLFTHNRSDQCNEQVSALTGLFANYTGFWQAWGAYLAHSEQGKEVSLALTFLAASFQNPQLRLSDVFTQGLQNLHLPQKPASTAPHVAAPLSTGLHEQENAATAPQAEGSQVPSSTLPNFAISTVPSPSLQRPDMQSAPATPNLSSVNISAAPTIDADPAPVQEQSLPTLHQPTVPPLAELVQSLPSTKDYAATNQGSGSVLLGDVDADEADDADDSEDGEERFSLRTRSMAEVLAEQGDFKNALEIYQELTAQAVTPEEQLDLQHRISTLTARMGTVQGQPAESPSLPDTAPGKHRLLSLLETLAVRFEAHAQG